MGFKRGTAAVRIMPALFLIMSGIVGAYSQDQALKPIIAVLDFKVSGIEKAEVDVFIDYLSSSLTQSGVYRVIDRVRREMLLKEIEMSVSDVSDEKYQLEIGKQISANKIVVGSIGKVGDRYLLTIKLIEVSTGETESSASEKYVDFNDLVDDGRRLAYQFVGKEDVLRTADPSTNAETAHSGQPAAVSPTVVTPAADQPAGSPRRHSGSALEAALGYFHFYNAYDDGISVKIGYMYQFNNFFSLGAELAGIFPLYNSEFSFYPLALKVSLGNKVDTFAVSLAAGLESVSLGLYFRNFFADLSWFSSSEILYSESLGFTAGYSIYFGK